MYNSGLAIGDFSHNPTKVVLSGLPYYLLDYLEFLDWTGRLIRDDNRGTVDANQPPILDRLCIETDQ
ncbi:hypothetical protein GCM10025791_44040 [Halioxenophilus aromaticivorans]|uniref:Uncharacterized protein n=1 Tax=Halioxenophilus aromaticivorans TaxID=1306992 RepID=A0AAV3U9D7_9ALTE